MALTCVLGYAAALAGGANALARGAEASAPAGEAKLNHPILDTERGYFLAPMRRGIRLTTGAEFALRDAIRTPVQLGRAEPIARELIPLAERLDVEPWMGARPCTPDMLPVIGRAPRHANLWFAFGHAHHGLTLAAVTGRLLAEMAGRTNGIARGRGGSFHPSDFTVGVLSSTGSVGHGAPLAAGAAWALARAGSGDAGVQRLPPPGGGAGDATRGLLEAGADPRARQGESGLHEVRAMASAPSRGS